MATKIAAGLALLLALSGWSLYKQVSANGKMREQMRQIEAYIKTERERVETLRLEIEERDEAVRLLEVEVDDLRKRKVKVQTIVREVYREPEVQEWALTAPPAAAIRAVRAAIDCLHDTASAPNGDCRNLTASGDDAGLP